MSEHCNGILLIVVTYCKISWLYNNPFMVSLAEKHGLIYLFQTVVYNVKCQETDASDHQYTSLLTYAQLLMIPPQERTGHKKSRYFNWNLWLFKQHSWIYIQHIKGHQNVLFWFHILEDEKILERFMYHEIVKCL